jgi:hypothetical protein
MAEKISSTQPGAEADFQFPLANPEEMTALNKRAFEMASRASRACFKCAAEYNQELTGFVNSRLKKDAEAMRATIGSKTSEEAFKAQAEFVSDLFKDYAEETSRMFALSAEAWKDAVSPDGQA